MAGRIGLDMRLFYNTGEAGGESPDWAELTDVKDVSIPLEKGDADISTRGTGKWRALRGTLKTGTLDFKMVYDPDDAGFATMQSAFLDDEVVDIAAVDDDGNGLRMVGEVFNFSRTEPLEDAVTVDVSIKPSQAVTAVSDVGTGS